MEILHRNTRVSLSRSQGKYKSWFLTWWVSRSSLRSGADYSDACKTHRAYLGTGMVFSHVDICSVPQSCEPPSCGHFGINPDSKAILFQSFPLSIPPHTHHMLRPGPLALISLYCPTQVATWLHGSLCAFRQHSFPSACPLHTQTPNVRHREQKRKESSPAACCWTCWPFGKTLKPVKSELHSYSTCRSDVPSKPSITDS